MAFRQRFLQAQVIGKSARERSHATEKAVAKLKRVGFVQLHGTRMHRETTKYSGDFEGDDL